MKKLFRCREFAVLGPSCDCYRKIKRLLSKESSLHAQFRDSKAAWWQHRLKFKQELLGADSYADACCLGIATCRWRRFANDDSGSELLSSGALLSYIELKGIWQLTPGHPMTGFAAGLRRPATNLASLQSGKRPTNRDRIAISSCVLFDSIWHEAELTHLFLEMLRTYESPDDVTDADRKRLAEPAISYANERLDHIDQAVFGGVVPHVPHAFSKIVKFWQDLGIEWLVAREALQEFRPDDLSC